MEDLEYFRIYHGFLFWRYIVQPLTITAVSDLIMHLHFGTIVNENITLGAGFTSCEQGQ